MGNPPAKVVRLSGARLAVALEPAVAERAGLGAGDELSAFAPGPLLLLARPGVGFFAGSLSTLSVGEALGFVCSGIRTGTLTLSGPEAERRLYFVDGQVVQADSTDPSEALGPVLCRGGMAAPDDVARFEEQAASETDLGRLMVDFGVLSPAQHYRAAQARVREIVMGAFGESEGQVAFVDGEPHPAARVNLPERTRSLLLAGLSRADQVARMRCVAPSDAVPARCSGGFPGLSEAQAAVLELADGERTVRQIAWDSRLGEFATLQALVELSEVGLVGLPAQVVPPEATAAPTPMDSPLQLYRAALRHVCETLLRAGVAGRLESFLEAVPEHQVGLFEGVPIVGGRDFDVDRVVANALRIHRGAMARAAALDALRSFLAFALFDARVCLSEAEAEALADEVEGLLHGR